ncbi:Uncharacterized protein BN1224_CV14_A_02300 [Chlamydia pneumoniae]|uniref:Uncharacterized protein n=1 Tax=Chlamydia pneumoniae TaxID=83558 RepID=A0A0F7X4H2_CHLPN|nr:Uncharacterized protein BN1224_Wien1_A_02290 [Chlamydia pneumoniae]CRI35585.1 Uncharacterized protein BN1224_CM1_A_02320 [Chlamydia pneumoniae]CRI36711.1 Uncharacterized protein BN1224_CV14_A_02300 [Chlamydia pneumoniae]CRI37835.1 Uncharacterized protein BN1224_CV15_B_01580 [Chlamydia pneumoniae]CRI38969.1 Uncharacterized protein BN1224_CWL011_A_02330 [Chlamydia pneumoniae]
MTHDIWNPRSSWPWDSCFSIKDSPNHHLLLATRPLERFLYAYRDLFRTGP